MVPKNASTKCMVSGMLREGGGRRCRYGVRLDVSPIAKAEEEFAVTIVPELVLQSVPASAAPSPSTGGPSCTATARRKPEGSSPTRPAMPAPPALNPPLSKISSPKLVLRRASPVHVDSDLGALAGAGTCSMGGDSSTFGTTVDHEDPSKRTSLVPMPMGTHGSEPILFVHKSAVSRPSRVKVREDDFWIVREDRAVPLHQRGGSVGSPDHRGHAGHQAADHDHNDNYTPALLDSTTFNSPTNDLRKNSVAHIPESPSLDLTDVGPADFSLLQEEGRPPLPDDPAASWPIGRPAKPRGPRPTSARPRSGRSNNRPVSAGRRGEGKKLFVSPRGGGPWGVVRAAVREGFLGTESRPGTRGAFPGAVPGDKPKRAAFK